MRRLVDRLLGVFAAGSAAVVCGLLAALLGFLLWKAWPVLDLALIVEPTARAGADGGLRYQILGTLLLAGTSLAVAVPLAVALAVVMAVLLPPGRLRATVELLLYSANGVPSILFGLFAFFVFGELLGWGKSWLAGGLVLGLMSVPTTAISLAERIAALPDKYLDAGRALGLRRAHLVRSVILPMSRDGLLSGALLGVARAAGETAPILFAAAVFAGATLPDGVVDSPVLALPYHLFVLAQDSFDPAIRARLWGAAWVLVAVAIGLALAALPLRLDPPREAAHG